MARQWVIAGLLLWPLSAAADETALQKAMQKDPDRFASRVVDLIAGFGGADGLRLEGIEEHIALERAGARASALRRFQSMDLDFDGSIDRDELAISQRAANADGRGRLERQFAGADANADGRADAAELAEQGRIAAFRALGEEEAGFLRSLMSLDADGNGALTTAEVERAVAGMGLDKAG